MISESFISFDNKVKGLIKDLNKDEKYANALKEITGTNNSDIKQKQFNTIKQEHRDNKNNIKESLQEAKLSL